MKKSALSILICLPALLAYGQLSKWSYYEDTTSTFSSPRAVDLTGDGIKDIVMGAGSEQKTKVSVVAVDGKDGSLLWKRNADDEMFISALFMDANSDKTMDVIIGGRTAELYCLDGDDGSVIWEFFPHNKNTAKDSGWFNFYQPQLIADQNQDGIQDLLISNGGDKSKSYTDTVGRPAGMLMVLSGKNGKVLAKIKVPDNRETYMAPIAHDFDNDNELDVIFGTGGETMSGALWTISLKDLMKEKASKAERLIFTGKKGFIPPPCVADINGDGFSDLIVNAYNGDLVAFSGEDFKPLWRIDMEGYETQCTPAIGNFIGSHHPDVLAVLYKGNAPSFKDYIQLVVDGRTGKIAWRDSLADLQFASPNAFDYDGDGFDEALFSFNYRNGSTFTHSIFSYNFKTSKIDSLVSSEKGINLSSTPLIDDIDGNGQIDLVYSVKKNDVNPVADDGVFIKMIPDICNMPAWGVAWGSYLGSDFTGAYQFMGKNCGTANLDFTFSKVQPSCNGIKDGSIQLLPSKGTKPIRYNWKDGTSTSKLSNKGEGDYYVRAIDNNGCIYFDTLKLRDPYEVTISADSTFCVGESSGNVTISSSGCQCAHSGCTYKWSNGSEDHGNFGVPAGVYSVILRHADGCTVYDTVEVFEADPILDTAIVRHVLCMGKDDGMIELVPFDTFDFEANWFHGTKRLLIDSLKPDTYRVEVRNFVWCYDTLEFIIREPDSLKMRLLDYRHVDCYGDSTGSITLSARGGWLPYSYMAGTMGYKDSIIQELKAGDYDLQIRDSAGCLSNQEKVSLQQRPEIQLFTSSLPQTDQFNGNGKAWVVPTGGLAPYRFAWNDPLNQQTDTAFNLKSNTYQVVVTDSLKCKKKASVFVDYSVGLIDNASEEAPFLVYPNPANDQITLNISAKGHLMISTIDGKEVLNTSVQRGTQTLDIGDWEKGVYLLEYQSLEGTIMQRVIIH